VFRSCDPKHSKMEHVQKRLSTNKLKSNYVIHLVEFDVRTV